MTPTPTPTDTDTDTDTDGQAIDIGTLGVMIDVDRFIATIDGQGAPDVWPFDLGDDLGDDDDDIDDWQGFAWGVWELGEDALRLARSYRGKVSGKVSQFVDQALARQAEYAGIGVRYYLQGADLRAMSNVADMARHCGQLVSGVLAKAVHPDSYTIADLAESVGAEDQVRTWEGLDQVADDDDDRYDLIANIFAPPIALPRDCDCHSWVTDAHDCQSPDYGHWPRMSVSKARQVLGEWIACPDTKIDIDTDDLRYLIARRGDEFAGSPYVIDQLVDRLSVALPDDDYARNLAMASALLVLGEYHDDTWASGALAPLPAISGGADLETITLAAMSGDDDARATLRRMTIARRRAMSGAGVSGTDKFSKGVRIARRQSRKAFARQSRRAARLTLRTGTWEDTDTDTDTYTDGQAWAELARRGLPPISGGSVTPDVGQAQCQYCESPPAYKGDLAPYPVKGNDTPTIIATLCGDCIGAVPMGVVWEYLAWDAWDGVGPAPSDFVDTQTITYAPIAYVYDADLHCPDCTPMAYRGDDAIDRRGNPVGVMSPWDDDHYDCDDCGKALPLGCGDCYESLAPDLGDWLPLCDCG